MENAVQAMRSKLNLDMADPKTLNIAAKAVVDQIINAMEGLLPHEGKGKLEEQIQELTQQNARFRSRGNSPSSMTPGKATPSHTPSKAEQLDAETTSIIGKFTRDPEHDSKRAVKLVINKLNDKSVNTKFKT
jgi:cell division septum initiation protein DivIVA